MIAIMNRMPDGRDVSGVVRPVHAWAWVHTLRTGDDIDNMQQVLDWAQDEMKRAGIAQETINDMISDEINHIMQAYNNKLGPKPELELDPDPPPLEIA